jgi:hypothetical protein
MFIGYGKKCNSSPKGSVPFSIFFVISDVRIFDFVADLAKLLALLSPPFSDGSSPVLWTKFFLQSNLLM